MRRGRGALRDETEGRPRPEVQPVPGREHQSPRSGGARSRVIAASVTGEESCRVGVSLAQAASCHQAEVAPGRNGHGEQRTLDHVGSRRGLELFFVEGHLELARSQPERTARGAFRRTRPSERRLRRARRSRPRGPCLPRSAASGSCLRSPGGNASTLVRPAPDRCCRPRVPSSETSGSPFERSPLASMRSRCSARLPALRRDPPRASQRSCVV